MLAVALRLLLAAQVAGATIPLAADGPLRQPGRQTLDFVFHLPPADDALIEPD